MLYTDGPRFARDAIDVPDAAERVERAEAAERRERLRRFAAEATAAELAQIVATEIEARRRAEEAADDLAAQLAELRARADRG